MVSEPGSGPDELAPSPAENPAATAPGGAATEEPVATAYAEQRRGRSDLRHRRSTTRARRW